MKLNKKGRVHPSLSSSSPVSYRDRSSVFKLLPVAILPQALSLPPQDQEVLAYMITRSPISSPTYFSTVPTHQHPKNKCKKGRGSVSQCGCFDCYTRFWHRWDSSSNRVLIHEVIEAFEDHLRQNEVPKKQSSRKKEKVIFSICHQSNGVSSDVEQSQDSQVWRVENEGSRSGEAANGGSPEEQEGDEEEEVEVVAAGSSGVSHKGLARKVLPDMVGLFNSRLWSLWGSSI